MTPTHPLIQNLYDLKDSGSIHPDVFPMFLSVTASFIDLHGDELFPNNGENVITDPADTDLKTRSLSTRWELEASQDELTKTGVGQLVSVLVRNIYAEISAEVSRSGLTYCPYVLIYPGSIIIDPNTFAPTVGFLSRYTLR